MTWNVPHSTRNIAIVLLVLIATSAPAIAGPVITDRTTFESYLTTNQPNDFAAVTLGLHSSPMSFGSGAFAYTISAPGGLVAADLAGDRFLDTNLASDAITITFTGGGVNAFGGWFFLTDKDDKWVGGNLTLTLSDGSTAVVDSKLTPFAGFIAAPGKYLTSAVIARTNTTSRNHWAAMDDLVVGYGTVTEPVEQVPEPGTALLAGLALIGIGLLKRRF